LKNIAYILLFIPLGIFCQNNNFTAKSSKNKIAIGEPTTVTLEFKSPASQLIDSVEFQLASNGDTLGNNWELWNKSTLEKNTYTEENGEFIIAFSQNFTIANFDSGSYVFPPSIVQFNSGKLFSNSLEFLVELDEIDEKSFIKNIKPIKEVSISWVEYIIHFLKKYGWWILLIIFTFFLGFFLFKKFYKKKTDAVYIQTIPLEITLLNTLKNIEEKKYWENGYFKKYYSELSNVLWQFLEYRYNVQTFEKTSGEILESLKWSTIPKKFSSEVSRFFEISDGVKFAKYKPLEKDNIHSFTTIKELINGQRLDLDTIESNQSTENE
tara:strand:+ start:3519 stop:4490 length:972 start_codon:yes stop_codon:yes gene_type:complete